MCDVAAIGPALNAIGSAAKISQENEGKKRAYNHKLKIRERKWFQTLSTYGSKKVQFEQEVDLGNIEAQRVYSEINLKLYNAYQTAILNDIPNFKKMLQGEGDILVNAAERGIKGNSLKRLLVQNAGNFGLTQAMTARSLTQAGYDAKAQKDYTRNRLKSHLNRSFSRVAIQPVADIAPPPPVLGNPGLALMLGMGQAVAAGIGAMDGKGDGTKDVKMNQGAGEYSYSNIGATPDYNPNFISQAPVMPSNPDFGFGNPWDTYNFMPSNPSYIGVGANRTGRHGAFMPSNPSYLGAGANRNFTGYY